VGADAFAEAGERVVHLVRHGEVENPRHVVYADLPGFHLSERGRVQAAATGALLAEWFVSAVVSSPLDRAVETARIVAAAAGVTSTVDDRLTEWKLSMRWAGTVWEQLPQRFPGELETYLADPASIAFAAETVAGLAARMQEAIEEHALQGGELVVVSHQDPVQAARFGMTGRSWNGFRHDKPGHGSVVTLRRSGGEFLWEETGYWEPDQGGDGFPPPALPGARR
jgi:broad specificity phosphatase PhoE